MSTRMEVAAKEALKYIGCGYVWGSTGQMCTQRELERLAAQYPKQTNIRTICPKWIGKRIFDCATLVRACLKAGEIKIRSGASSQWRGDYWQEKGEIADMPRDRPCVLYNTSKNANPMGHTGIYLGDGWVVDARGSRYGVLHTKLESRTWTHYAVPKRAMEEIGTPSAQAKTAVQPEGKVPLQVDQNAIGFATVTAPSGNTVRLRAQPSKRASVITALPIGTDVSVLEKAEVVAWKKISTNGQTGWMMAEFLQDQQVYG